MSAEAVFVLAIWVDELGCWSPMIVSCRLAELRLLSLRLSSFLHVWCRIVQVERDDDVVIESVLVSLKPPSVEARFGTRKGVPA